MARLVLISLYDKGVIGARSVCASAKAAGHHVSMIYMKEYGKARVKDVAGVPEDRMHTGYTLWGEEMVFGLVSPVSAREETLLVDLLDRLAPDVVGFSLRTCAFRTAEHLTKVIRARTGLPVVWGGIHPTVDPEGSIACADIVCIGEGERPVMELLDRMDRHEPYNDIENLWLRHGDRVVRNPLRPLIQDLDSLPFPDYAPADKYCIDNDQVFEDPSLTNFSGVYEVMTARGCPNSCSYCCNDALRSLYAGQRYLRRRSVANVIDELQLARDEYQAEFINFYDDVFTYDKNWVEQFSSVYKERVGLPFWCYISPIQYNVETLKILMGCGLRKVTCGVQSGSERILSYIFNRRMTNEAVLECVSALRELGLSFDIDIITDNPFETEEDCRQSLRLLLEFPGRVPFNDGLSKLSFFPNAKISSMLEEQELSQCVDRRTYAFYNRLYLLTQFSVPRGLILRMSQSTFLKKHPSLLKPFFIIPKYRVASVSRLRDQLKRWLPKGAVQIIRGMVRPGVATS